jgi:hypothetical protein
LEVVVMIQQEHWIKLWNRWFIGESHVLFSPAELGIATYALMLARLHVQENGSAIVALKDGTPLTRSGFVAAALRNRRQNKWERSLVLDAVEHLLRAGTLEERKSDGAIVVPGWTKWQESQEPGAERTRRWRRQRSVTGASPANGSGDGRSTHKTEDRRTEGQSIFKPRHTPARKRKAPPRPSKKNALHSREFFVAVCDWMTEAKRSLPDNEEARAIAPTPTNRDVIAEAANVVGTDLGHWKHVIEAKRREVLSQGPDGYRYLSLRIICDPKAFQTLLDAPLPPLPRDEDRNSNPANLPTGSAPNPELEDISDVPF